MAIYRHLESKEVLLDGIRGELELPDVRGGQWQEELRVTARSFRALLIAHPAAMAIFTDRPLFIPAALRTANAMLGLLRGGIQS